MFEGATSEPPGAAEAEGLGAASPAVIELLAAVDRLARAGVVAEAGELRTLRGALDRLTSLLVEAEVRFDTEQSWRADGASSHRAWSVTEGGMGRREAGRWARRVERLAAWPMVAAAWRAGDLSEGQVDAMVGIVPSRFAALFAERSPEVIATVRAFDVDRTERAVRQWVELAESEHDDAHDHLYERRSTAHASVLMDGSLSVAALLHGADAAVVESALRVFDVPDALDADGVPIGPPRTIAQRVAESLVSMARFALDHRDGPGEHGRFVPHVSLLVDVVEMRAAALRDLGVSTLDELDRVAADRGWSRSERRVYADALAHHGQCATTDGLLLDAAAMSALCCDSVVQRVFTAGSRVLDLGREVRTATPAQRRAVVARDRHCRAPGCRTRPRHCEVHHVDPWILGGRTDVDRMVLLCGAHHREFHRDGYRMDLAPDGRFTVTRSRGSEAEWSRSTMPEPDIELVFPRSA